MLAWLHDARAVDEAIDEFRRIGRAALLRQVYRLRVGATCARTDTSSTSRPSPARPAAINTPRNVR